MKSKKNSSGDLSPARFRDSSPEGVHWAKPPKNFEFRALGGLKMSNPDSMF